MKSFFDAINNPVEAYRNKNKMAAWFLVISAILVNAVFEPLLAWRAGAMHPTPGIHMMIRTTLLGCASYLVICLVLWIVCKCFGSNTSLIDYIETWGLTFFPNLLCSFAVAFSETFFTVFWNNSIWGMLLSVIFVGILIWKAILYVIFLKEVSGLVGVRTFGAFIVTGIVIIAMTMLNGYAGLKTPIL